MWDSLVEVTQDLVGQSNYAVATFPPSLRLLAFLATGYMLLACSWHVARMKEEGQRVGMGFEACICTVSWLTCRMCLIVPGSAAPGIC